MEKTWPSFSKNARELLHRRRAKAREARGRPLTLATRGRVPEVGQAEEAQLRPQLVHADTVARGAARPDDLQHLDGNHNVD